MRKELERARWSLGETVVVVDFRTKGLLHGGTNLFRWADQAQQRRNYKQMAFRNHGRLGQGHGIRLPQKW